MAGLKPKFIFLKNYISLESAREKKIPKKVLPSSHPEATLRTYLDI
jgi:hypothetical protein